MKYIKFTEESYDKFLASIKGEADENYAAFNAKTAPGSRPAMGIRVPRLRAIAKEIIKGDAKGFLSCKNSGYHEEDMLRAMVIAGAEMDMDERLEHIRDFVPTINNWAVCDTLCNDFKKARKHRAELWDFITGYLSHETEFEIRFGMVMLLWHYTTEEYTEKSLKLIAEVDSEYYYVKMAAAWAYSQFFVYQRDLTLPFIEAGILEPWTQNKAIQKIRESYRVSKEDKEYLLKFKM